MEDSREHVSQFGRALPEDLLTLGQPLRQAVLRLELMLVAVAGDRHSSGSERLALANCVPPP